MGAVAVAVADLEADHGCVPGGVVVEEEVGSGGVCSHCHISLVRQLGAMRSYAFAFPPKPRGRHILSLVEAYSVGGGAFYQWRRWRQKGKLAQIVRKCIE